MTKEELLLDFKKEIERLQFERKSNTNVFKYSEKLPNKSKKVLDSIEKNNNNSWALFMFERNLSSKSMNKNAIQYRGNQITYKEMYLKVFEYCKSLKALGVKKGDQIPVCISNVPEYIYLLLACNFVGATIHLVGSWFNKDYLKKIINDTNSKIMFISEDNYSKISDCINESNIETQVLISLEDSLKRDVYGKPYNPYQKIEGELHDFSSKYLEIKETSSKKIISQEEFLKNGINYNGNVFENVGLDDIATITYTSGTTEKGCPKGVMHTNRVYITVSRFKLSDVSGMPEMKDLTTLFEIPVYSHTNISNVADTLFCNCTYISEPFNETSFFPTSLLINKPNYCQSPIGRWLYLGKELDKEGNKNVKFPFLMMADIVGEGCSAGEEKFLNRIAREHKFGTKKLPFPLAPVTFTLGGGTCEGGGLFFTLFHELQEKRLLFYGKEYSLGLLPVKMAEYEILNKDGDYCDINEPGLLVVNSPANMAGYTNENLNDSAYIYDKYGKKWINMGTLSYKSDPKFKSIKMKSRANDYVILQDGTLFPTFKIEESISKDTKNIMSCVVVKMDDNTYVCHIEKQPNSKKDIKNILTACALRLKKDLPKEIYERIWFRIRSFEEGFPIAESGKRDYSYLKNEVNNNLLYVEDLFVKELNHGNSMMLKLKKQK